MNLVLSQLSPCANEGTGGYSAWPGEVLRKNLASPGRFFLQTCAPWAITQPPAAHLRDPLRVSHAAQAAIIDQSENYPKASTPLRISTN